MLIHLNTKQINIDSFMLRKKLGLCILPSFITSRSNFKEPSVSSKWDIFGFTTLMYKSNEMQNKKKCANNLYS